MWLEHHWVHHSPMNGHLYSFYVFIAIVIIGDNSAKTNKRCEYRKSDFKSHQFFLLQGVPDHLRAHCVPHFSFHFLFHSLHTYWSPLLIFHDPSFSSFNFKKHIKCCLHNNTDLESNRPEFKYSIHCVNL